MKTAILMKFIIIIIIVVSIIIGSIITSIFSKAVCWWFFLSTNPKTNNVIVGLSIFEMNIIIIYLFIDFLLKLFLKAQQDSETAGHCRFNKPLSSRRKEFVGNFF